MEEKQFPAIIKSVTNKWGLSALVVLIYASLTPFFLHGIPDNLRFVAWVIFPLLLVALCHWVHKLVSSSDKLLPKNDKAQEAISDSVKKITENKKSATLSLPKPYVEWIKQECSYMQAEKMAGKGQVVRPELPEVFVHLYANEPVEEYKTKKNRKKSTEAFEDKSRGMDLETMIAKNDYLLIEGQAGSGKTTLLKHLSYVLANGKEVPKGLEGYLPVLVFLKDLKPFIDVSPKANILADEILSRYFETRNSILEDDILKAFGAGGKILFLLDGLDEIEEAQRNTIVRAFSDYRCKKSGNKVVFSGRPHGIAGAATDLFGKMKVSVLPFNTEQIHEFINKWFLYVYSKSENKGKRTASEMISEINGHDAISKLLDNPLMLTAICILYHDGKELPNQRAELYKKFIDNMIYRRFEDQEKVQDFLRTLANDMHKEKVKTVDRSFAISSLKKVYREDHEENEAAYKKRMDKLFDEIEPQCGLMKLEGAQYGFWHLTFQEYLTAVYIVDNNTQFDEAILSFWDDPWYEEVVKLYIGYLSMEHKQWATKIIRNAIDDEKASVRKKLLAAEALVDIHPDRRDPDFEDEARNHMWEMIHKSQKPKDMARAGEIIGYLGDIRDLKEFVKIEVTWKRHIQSRKKDLKEFEICKYPVTNSWFAEFVKDKGYEKKEFWSKEGWKWLVENNIRQPGLWDNRTWRCPNAPVVGVAWYEADAFAKWLTQSRKDGFTYRLPTENEWQASAAGKEGREFPWGSGWDEKMCNNSKTGINKTSSVGIFGTGVTPEGLYDMAGNVWEWTSSFYDNDKYYYLLRGGSWDDDDVVYFRCADRVDNNPFERNNLIGFRCART